MKVKVCGMREPQNIQAVASLGVDYLGLIFYPPSSRFVAGETGEIDVPKFGVFVNEKLGVIRRKAAEHGLEYLQLHGDESPETCAELQRDGYKIVKAFRVNDDFDFGWTKPYETCVDYFLFDAKGKKYGGNGIQFNWDKLKEYKGKNPFFLSGGINPESLVDIKQFQHPKLFGLDLNSGFEISPAYKDVDVLRHFLEQLQENTHSQ